MNQMIQMCMRKSMGDDFENRNDIRKRGLNFALANNLDRSTLSIRSKKNLLVTFKSGKDNSQIDWFMIKKDLISCKNYKTIIEKV